MVAVIHHLDLATFGVAEDVEVVVDQLQLVQGIVDAHRGHVVVLAPYAPAGQFGLLAVHQAATRCRQIGGGAGLLIAGGAMHRPLGQLLDAVLVAEQLAAELAGHQVDAGVEVVAALLGADHGAIGKHRDFNRLLRYPGIAGHRQVHIGLFNKALKVVNGAVQLGFGVLPNGGSDVKIAAMDQQFHQMATASGLLVHQR